jgi:hypothetical protein
MNQTVPAMLANERAKIDIEHGYWVFSAPVKIDRSVFAVRLRRFHRNTVLRSSRVAKSGAAASDAVASKLRRSQLQQIVTWA